MKHSILIFACAVVFAALGAAASISGTVKGADGSSIKAGAVTASRQPDLTPRLQASFPPSVQRPAYPRTSTASAAILPDGTFKLPPLPDGVYQVCAQAPGTVWLNSCEWGQNGVTASLTPKLALVPVPIVLTKGALVTVRVNDPAQLLAAHEGITPGAHLLVGAISDSRFFHAAAVVSKDAGGRNYQLLVPFARSVNISVASARFQLTDATGRTLPKFGNLIPVMVASGQAASPLVVNVGNIVPGPLP